MASRKDKMILLGGSKKVQFIYQVTVTDSQATTPKFTFGDGAPDAVVNFGDGTEFEAVTSGVEMNHVYTTGGVYTVTLISERQEEYLTQIDIIVDKVSYIFTPINLFTNLTYFSAYVNAAWVQDITSWRLTSSIQTFMALLTGVTGNISNWVMPASMVDFRIYSTVLTGCPNLSNAIGITNCEVKDCGLPQATVDLYLAGFAAIEALTTYATPNLDLSGTNSTPSTYGWWQSSILTAASWTVTNTGSAPVAPKFFDNFTRDDEYLDFSTEGFPYYTKANGIIGLPQVRSNVMDVVDAPAPTASYAFVDLPSTPTSVTIKVKWKNDAAGNGGPAVIAISDDALGFFRPFYRPSIHFYVSTINWVLQVVEEDGTFVDLDNGAGLELATGTEYTMTIAVSGNNATLTIPTIAEPVVVTDARIGSFNGRFVFYEIYRETAMKTPTFTYIEAVY